MEPIAIKIMEVSVHTASRVTSFVELGLVELGLGLANQNCWPG